MNAAKFEYDWTIMLYLSGDNSLSEDMIRALKDIATEGPPERVAITIQYDPRAPGLPTFVYALGDKVPVQENQELAEKTEAEFGPLPIRQHLKDLVLNENSADPKVLADFIRWSAKNYQSKYRMLILSGHGSGAVGDFLTDGNAKSGQPGSLTIPRLRRAFELAQGGGGHERRHGESFSEQELTSAGEGRPRLLDVLGMDSCLMGMAEVCHEVSEFVDYLVGSEGFVPNAGWPYAYLLDRLKKRKDRRPAELAKCIVDDVVAHYTGFVPAGVSIDMSACELSEIKMKALADAVAKLSQALRAGLADPAIQDLIVTAHWRAQSYKREQHTDLLDFSALLQTIAARSQAGKKTEELIEACEEVVKAVKTTVIRQGSCGIEFQYSHGLSVYFPWSFTTLSTLRPYSRLRFAAGQASGWSRFLEGYLRETQRQPRQSQAAEAGAGVDTATADEASFGGGRSADGVTAAAAGHRDNERLNRDNERVNRFIAELYAGYGAMLPWSMKNPPTRAPKPAPVQEHKSAPPPSVTPNAPKLSP
jgi:Clostripain family